MRKLLQLTKVFLVAILLGAGTGNVLADDVASYNFNDNTASLPFSISDSYAIGGSYVLYEAEGSDYYAKYTCNNSNRLSLAYYSFASGVSDASTVTVEFDFLVHLGSWQCLISLADANYHTVADGGFTAKSNSGYGTNGAIFNFGCYRASGSNHFAINSTQNSSLDETCLDTWCHASITVDNVNKTVDYTIQNQAKTSTLASATGVAFLNASAMRCSQIDIYLGSNTDNYAYIDNLVITKTVVATNHNYTVNAVAGGATIKQLLAGIAAESSAYSIYIPEVIKYNGNYYELDDESNANLDNYLASYTLGTEDEIQEINYTLNPFVIYYGDWETAYSTSSSNYGVTSNQSKLSQGKGRTINKTDITMSLTFTAPVAGTYLVEIPYLNTNSSARTHILYLDGTEEANQLESRSVAKNGGYGTYSEALSLTAGEHTIYVKCTYNLTAAMDYLKVTLQKVPATVGANGYTTFASPYALDLTDANRPEGLKAYKATLTGTTLTFTALNQTVPAGTGLLLLGETKGGTYSIPVVAEGTALDNALVGVTSATPLQSTVTGGANVYYFVMKKAASESAPLSFAPLSTSSAVAIPAGKAYVALDTSTGARTLTVSFDDETTGLKAIDNEQWTIDNQVYNLQGQRVDAPSKGLYIVNGKKVLVK